MMSELEAKEQFYACKQDNNESPEDYMYKLKAWADVVKHCGGNIAGNLENIPEDFGNQEAWEEAALDYTLELAYIKGVYRTRYGVLVVELKNDYVKGQDDNQQIWIQHLL
jgi:hypothetical protein